MFVKKERMLLLKRGRTFYWVYLATKYPKKLQLKPPISILFSFIHVKYLSIPTSDLIPLPSPLSLILSKYCEMIY